jgi:hypothetical protein
MLRINVPVGGMANAGTKASAARDAAPAGGADTTTGLVARKAPGLGLAARPWRGGQPDSAALGQTQGRHRPPSGAEGQTTPGQWRA